MKRIVIESQFLYRYDKPEDGITVGGTQRYAYELGRYFKDLGWEVVFLTKANRYYEGKFYDIGKVIALESPYGQKGLYSFSKKVYDYCKAVNADLVCYSDLPVAFFKCYEKSFALQHGISWDNPTEGLKGTIQKYLYLKSAERFDNIICVDTNFINWIRERSKTFFKNPNYLHYIPNFADEKMFRYRYKEWKDNETFKLLYPRRFVKHRGYDIFIETCMRLINEGYDVEGIIACEDFRYEEIICKYPEFEKFNIKVVNPLMGEIATLYQNAFLTYVPTRWSEGTSLSAIESLLCGCPVIVSDVGGLGNLVLPNFNGIILPPTLENFYLTTKELIDNPQKRNEMARNCINMEKFFGLKRWRAQIGDALEGKL